MQHNVATLAILEAHGNKPRKKPPTTLHRVASSTQEKEKDETKSKHAHVTIQLNHNRKQNKE